MSTRSECSKSPRQVLVSVKSRASRVPAGSPAAKYLRRPLPQVGSVSRSVSSVASGCVAFAYGQSPRDVLAGTFRELKQAARSNLSMRIGERLAHLSGPVRVGRIDSPPSEWRQLSDVVSAVLRRIEPQRS